MKCEYKRDLNNNYMILQDENQTLMEDYRVKMLISNKIPFMLKCNMRKFDCIVKYYYEITSKHPLSRVYDKKKIGTKELHNIVTSFLRVLDSSSEYLLNPDDFILNPEYIYMNIETSQIYFCYMPGHEMEVSMGFNELTTYLLDKIDHEDKHAVATAYELYRQTLSDNYSIREILSSIQNEEVKKEDISEEEFPEEISVREEKLVSDKKKNLLPFGNNEKQNNEKQKENFRPRKSVYIFSGMVVVISIVLLSYFLNQNKEIIGSVKLNSELITKIAGVILIIAVIVIYSIYKNYQSKKEQDDDIFVITQEQGKQQFDAVRKGEFTRTKEEIKKTSKANVVDDKKRMEETKDKENRIEDSHIIKADFSNKQMGTYGNTVLLAYKAPDKKLIASGEKNQSFTLGKRPFLIGKMEEHVDGVIQDEMVSRIHAEIKNDNGSYFLTDLNSTNGTFLNGRRLEANETAAIREEDVICFATAQYVFR